MSVWSASAGLAQTELTPDQARLTAANLLQSGQPAAARDLTQVLVARDPKDAHAWIIQAHAQRVMNQHSQAQESGRRAWAASDTEIEQYGSALAMAQALASDGKKTRAQVWLRRAVEVAPTEALRARAVRDYQFVRMTNPWSINLSFGINPSDNVNNAPTDNSFEVGGLRFIDPAAIPLEGIEFNLRSTLRRNFNISQTRRDFVAFSWDATHVLLTDSFIPPGVSDSDFTYHRFETKIGRDFAGGPDKPRRTVGLSYGRVWYGGEHLADEVEVDFNEFRLRGPDRSFAWGGSLGYSERQDSDLRSGPQAMVDARWTRQLGGGGFLSWSAELYRTDTDSAAVTHTRLELGTRYVFAQPVLGARASVGLTGLIRRYDDPLYGPEARADDGASFEASLWFLDFDTHGFAPKLTFKANRVDSNVRRFETRNLGISIGFQSVF